MKPPHPHQRGRGGQPACPVEADLLDRFLKEGRTHLDLPLTWEQNADDVAITI